MISFAVRVVSVGLLWLMNGCTKDESIEGWSEEARPVLTRLKDISNEFKSVIFHERSKTFLAVASDGIWRISEDGLTIDSTPFEQGELLDDLVVGPSDNSLLAFGRNGAVFRSPDAGRTWIPASVV